MTDKITEAVANAIDDEFNKNTDDEPSSYQLAAAAIDTYRKLVASEAVAWMPPQDCDGKEQIAFEVWAASKRYDMHEHPLHYLFMDKSTNAARQGWKAALSYVRDTFAAPPAPQPSTEDGHIWHEKVFSSMKIKCCMNCGFIKNEDKPNKPCPGPIGVGLRESAPAPIPADWFSQIVNFFVRHDMLDAREEYDINDVMSALADNYEPAIPAGWEYNIDECPILEHSYALLSSGEVKVVWRKANGDFDYFRFNEIKAWMPLQKPPAPTPEAGE